jgi:hypothetical protein
VLILLIQRVYGIVIDEGAVAYLRKWGSSLKTKPSEQEVRRKADDFFALSALCMAECTVFRRVCTDLSRRGSQLVTIEDAGNYITKLPRAEHEAPEWQAAMECLILVAEENGPTMLARICVMRALNRHVERVFNPDRKDPH